jgi:hypothetical protein
MEVQRLLTSYDFLTALTTVTFNGMLKLVFQLAVMTHNF